MAEPLVYGRANAIAGRVVGIDRLRDAVLWTQRATAGGSERATRTAELRTSPTRSITHMVRAGIVFAGHSGRRSKGTIGGYSLTEFAMKWDGIWKRARSDLVIATKQGDQDVFLWEHSVRVAESARRIAELPEVQSADPDDLAIVAGALYHDAGWVVRLQSGEIAREEVLVLPTSDDHREQGAEMLERSLVKLVPAASLERASQAIRTLNNRNISSIEGKVITEAHNLDEFGMVSIWTSARRGAADGKGIQAVLDMWRRRNEFHFWTARLNNAFRFEPIRDLAQRRLELLDGYMEELEVQHKGADLSTIPI